MAANRYSYFWDSQIDDLCSKKEVCMSKTSRIATLALGALFWLLLSAAVNTAFATGAIAINENDRLVLPGNVHPAAKPQNDIGRANAQSPESRMILLLKLSPDKQAALDKFSAEQLDKSSANYHHWLTPEEFGKRFGRSPATVARVKGWLVSHGFNVQQVAKGGNWINFSGTIGQVESTFHTQIHKYLLNGKTYHANSTDPSIPRALADVVAGPVSLNNFPIKTRPKPQYYDPNKGSYELSPYDFYQVYNVPTSSYSGAGVTIAIAGDTTSTSWPADWDSFRSNFNLPANTPTIICNPANTCPANSPDDEYESDLDVEWAGAVAYGATIDYVTSQSTNSNLGVDFSSQYVVDNKLAPILSESYGVSELDMGTTWCAFYNTIWQQAAAEGITVFVSSGDQGAYMSMTSSISVNGMASTPYNVAVGGTEFANQSSSSFSNYWNSNGYAIGYIPETCWNDGYDSNGKLWASGGGVSTLYTKPAWQVCPGVPTDGMRDMPDVSLDASNNVGYEVMIQGALQDIGGTSASSPSLAGIMALIVQNLGGAWQGNANPVFYQLGNAQYSGTQGASVVYHNITTGDNGYYASGPGYNQTTGLGSVDATALIHAFTPLQGGSVTVTITPAAAVSAGAMWAVDGGSWNTSGSTASSLSAGSHTVSFETISGWTTPGSQTVSVTAGQTTSVTGTYTQTQNAACGSSSGGDFYSAPTSNLCSSGNASQVTNNGSGSWVWSCAGTNGGSNVACSAGVEANGACGSSSGGSFTSAPSSNLCSVGTSTQVLGSGPWTWSCQGLNGGTNANCSASLSGGCGWANGQSFFKTPPSSELCISGKASRLSGRGPWYWTCTGSNGGGTQSCSANLEVNGLCGAASGKAYFSAPTSSLCKSGTASSLTGSGPWGWTCQGINGGTSSSCSATLKVNGTCGSANKGNFFTQPDSSLLCNSGNPSSVVTTRGLFQWRCAGSNGGSSRSCSAKQEINGACGYANGASFLKVPPLQSLCSAGKASRVVGKGPWSWSCAGSNGGGTASCSAQLQ